MDVYHLLSMTSPCCHASRHLSHQHSRAAAGTFFTSPAAPHLHAPAPRRCQTACEPSDQFSVRCAASTQQSAAAAAAEATSLIPQTMEEMAADEDAAAMRELLERRGQAALTREERRRRQRSLDSIDAPPFQRVLQVRLCTPVMQRQAAAH